MEQRRYEICDNCGRRCGADRTNTCIGSGPDDFDDNYHFCSARCEDTFIAKLNAEGQRAHEQQEQREAQLYRDLQNSCDD